MNIFQDVCAEFFMLKLAAGWVYRIISFLATINVSPALTNWVNCRMRRDDSHDTRESLALFHVIQFGIGRVWGAKGCEPTLCELVFQHCCTSSGASVPWRTLARCPGCSSRYIAISWYFDQDVWRLYVDFSFEIITKARLASKSMAPFPTLASFTSWMKACSTYWIFWRLRKYELTQIFF